MGEAVLVLSENSLNSDAGGVPLTAGRLVVNGDLLEGGTVSNEAGLGLEVVTGEGGCVGGEHTARESVTIINSICTNLIITIWIYQMTPEVYRHIE